MARLRGQHLFNTALIGAVFVVALDRFCKIMALSFGQEKTFLLVGDFFSFAYSPNINLAFSLPSLLRPLYIIPPIIIIIGYSFWKSLRQCRYQTATALGLILCGAISNFYDRVAYGSVIDYLDLRYFTVFNLADILISVGVIYIIVQNLWLRDKPEVA